MIRKTAAVFVVLALAAGDASGSGFEGFDAHGFEPPSDPFGFAAVEGARKLDPGEVFGGAIASWADDPLEIGRVHVIDDLGTVDVVAGAGVADVLTWRGGLAVGIDVPVAFLEEGDEVEDPRSDLRPCGVGDVRTDVKLGLYHPEDDHVGVAVKVYAEWPTGRARDFLTDGDRISVGVLAVVEKRITVFRLAFNFGYEWIDGDIEAGDGGGGDGGGGGSGGGGRAGDSVEVDDRGRIGVGFAIAPLHDILGWEDLETFFELTHTFRAPHPWDREEESPVEAGGGLRYLGGPGLFLLGGFATGLNDGAALPDFRAYAGAGIRF